MEDLEGGFHPIWYYDTRMLISPNSYTIKETYGINSYYAAYEFMEKGFLKVQRDDANCLINFEAILIGNAIPGDNNDT